MLISILDEVISTPILRLVCIMSYEKIFTMKNNCRKLLLTTTFTEPTHFHAKLVLSASSVLNGVIFNVRWLFSLPD